MKTLTFFLVSLLISSTMAGEFAERDLFFRIDSSTAFGGRVYYDCDHVENKTRSMLKTLGAQDIEVRCSGGIDPFGQRSISWESSVKTTFKAPTSGKYQAVEFSDFDSCHLASEILDNIDESFITRNTDRSRLCFMHDEPYTITLEVLK